MVETAIDNTIRTERTANVYLITRLADEIESTRQEANNMNENETRERQWKMLSDANWEEAEQAF